MVTSLWLNQSESELICIQPWSLRLVLKVTLYCRRLMEPTTAIKHFTKGYTFEPYAWLTVQPQGIFFRSHWTWGRPILISKQFFFCFFFKEKKRRRNERLLFCLLVHHSQILLLGSKQVFNAQSTIAAAEKGKKFGHKGVSGSENIFWKKPGHMDTDGHTDTVMPVYTQFCYRGYKKKLKA